MRKNKEKQVIKDGKKARLFHDWVKKKKKSRKGARKRSTHEGSENSSICYSVNKRPNDRN